MSPATTFDSLPGTLASPPSSPRRRRSPKHWAQRLERCCCRTLAYFPLVFVYGLTTWAVCVEVSVSFFGKSISDNSSFASRAGVWGWTKAVVGVLLWGLANTSYTVAVFTPPGAPSDERRDAARSRRSGGYAGLPTYEDDERDTGSHSQHPGMTMVTAKNNGQPRYCQKCQTLKPDRSHHCSTCRQCVLKMDHHCPWLATCVGLHNYKPFLLFLLYTSLFCWVCFVVSGSWVYVEIMDETQMQEGMRVVHTILLAVLGGIIGLVLSGFTGWHVYLAATGQTTIESLEKTRYLSPLRKKLETPWQVQGRGRGNARDYADQAPTEGLVDHLKDIHANALPSILRPEEGEAIPPVNLSRATTPAPPSQSHSYSHSPAEDSLHRSYASIEAQREQDRYTAYLDETDSEKLPNAFGMGWRRNLLHVFGERPLYWGLPVCNTSGDGWVWEVSPKWTEAREELARQREAQQAHGAASWDSGASATTQAPAFEPPRRDLRWTPGQGFVSPAARHAPPPRMSMVQAGVVLSPPRRTQAHNYSPGSESQMQMQPLDRRKGDTHSHGHGEADSYETSSSNSSDEEVKRMYAHEQIQGTRVGDWNDVPDDFLTAPRRGVGAGARVRSRSRGRRKGD
ncbi:palmitoyltransferase for Vac8p [Teratosphaeriaceae sp. CCFEE 6253]|nr:palmitoyltransferase for Vac8p [Teratosphaeriaceae sp. CCFEE 6253]